MTYSVTADYRTGMPRSPKNNLPWKLIACHDTEGGTGLAGALGTISYLIAHPERNASYHELWHYTEITDAFGAIRIVPKTHCSHSLNPVPPPNGSYEPDPWVRSELGAGVNDPNQGVYAVSIAGRVADVDRYSGNPKFVAHAQRRIGELRAEFPTLSGLAEHFRFNPSTRSDWGRLLTPKLGGLDLGATLPDTSIPEDDVDPTKDIPVAVCDVASGGTLYADPDRKVQKAASWPGGTDIPIYSKPLVAIGSPTPLAALRLSSSGGVNPYVGWIGWDKVSNVRVPGAAVGFTQAQLDAAAKTAAHDAAAKVADAAEIKASEF